MDGGQGAQEGGGAGGPGEAEEEFDLADILEEAVQGSASKEARLEEIEAQLQVPSWPASVEGCVWGYLGTGGGGVGGRG